jgi:hypothetical protein
VAPSSVTVATTLDRDRVFPHLQILRLATVATKRSSLRGRLLGFGLDLPKLLCDRKHLGANGSSTRGRDPDLSGPCSCRHVGGYLRVRVDAKGGRLHSAECHLSCLRKAHSSNHHRCPHVAARRSETQNLRCHVELLVAGQGSRASSHRHSPLEHLTLSGLPDFWASSTPSVHLPVLFRLFDHGAQTAQDLKNTACGVEVRNTALRFYLDPRPKPPHEMLLVFVLW